MLETRKKTTFLEVINKPTMNKLIDDFAIKKEYVYDGFFSHRSLLKIVKVLQENNWNMVRTKYLTGISRCYDPLNLLGN